MSSVSSLNSLLSSSSPSNASSVNISSLLAAATGATSVGIDVTSAVDAAVYAAQAPERQWQAQQATLQSQITAVTGIQKALASVSTDLDQLNDPQGSLAARAVTSSNSAVVTATATPGAIVGSHVITVASLATSASWYSTSMSGANGSLGSSTLTITQSSGTQTSFALGGSGSTSLAALASAINAASLGINASVINDATGSRLALVGQVTGSAANFTVSDAGAVAPTFTSASLASSSAPLTAGTFQIGDGAGSATLNVAAGSTLANLANQINSQGLNLTASVVTDSAGAHLSVTGNSGNSVSLSSDPAFVLTQPSVGSDASLKVDGIPITSSSNTVTGAVKGLTLNLQGVTNGSPVTLGVAADANQISAAVSQFVTDYNSALSLVSSQFTYSTASGSQGVLGSDATIRSLQSTLLGFGSYSTSLGGSSSSSSATPIRSMADLGITMNNDGSLSLNTATLEQAVTTSPSGVQNFFQGTALNGFASSVQANLKVFSDPGSGVLTEDLNNMTQQNNGLQSDVNNYESGYIASQRTVLTNMYSKAEIALQQLPATLKQLQAQLGNNSSGG